MALARDDWECVVVVVGAVRAPPRLKKRKEEAKVDLKVFHAKDCQDFPA